MLSEIIDFIFGACLVFNAFVFIPQAIKIFKTKSTKGLSLLTFSGFNIVQIFTILHGYIHDDKYLLYGNLLALIFSGLVTFFIIKYRHK